jgi:hypothetical protein
MTKRICKHCKKEIYDIGGLNGTLGWYHQHSRLPYCDEPITPRAEPDQLIGENPSDLLEEIVHAVDAVRDLIDAHREKNEHPRKADVVPFPR